MDDIRSAITKAMAYNRIRSLPLSYVNFRFLKSGPEVRSVRGGRTEPALPAPTIPRIATCRASQPALPPAIVDTSTTRPWRGLETPVKGPAAAWSTTTSS